MAFILKRVENSLDAFRAALEAGMDGFYLGVQPTRDAVCVVASDSASRSMKYNELPRLKNGEAVSKLMDVLEFPAKLSVIELMGEPGWKNALAAVEAQDSLGRVIFSSLEHSEILQLWAACPRARCGFVWEEDEAGAITEEEVSDLPEALLLHVPINSIHKRADFWKKYANRLAVWGVTDYEHIKSIGFDPFACAVDF